MQHLSFTTVPTGYRVIYRRVCIADIVRWRKRWLFVTDNSFKTGQTITAIVDFIHDRIQRYEQKLARA